VEGGHEVLFLARLQARKRPRVFVEAALALRERFPQARFTLVGPDEGEGEAVRARIAHAGASGTVRWEGPLDPGETLARMSQASIYVLPSVDEPFPMTVLEAMSIGLPTIVTDTCGLIGDLRDPTSLRVVDVSVDALVAEIASLLGDSAARAALGQRARREVESYFSIDQVANTVLAAYAQVVSQRQGAR
jgi:glycosyltransferase involved in cell wall biosynthesis